MTTTFVPMVNLAQAKAWLLAENRLNRWNHACYRAGAEKDLTLDEAAAFLLKANAKQRAEIMEYLE